MCVHTYTQSRAIKSKAHISVSPEVDFRVRACVCVCLKEGRKASEQLWAPVTHADSHRVACNGSGYIHYMHSQVAEQVQLQPQAIP